MQTYRISVLLVVAVTQVQKRIKEYSASAQKTEAANWCDTYFTNRQKFKSKFTLRVNIFQIPLKTFTSQAIP